MIARPTSVEALQSHVRDNEHVRVCGAGTKPGLSDGATVSVGALNGVVEYDPREFVVTVQAGMPVAELARVLSQEGQALPFDPPFADRGATVGGTIASGLSGAGRARYGGVRDFLLGVTFIDARGQRVRGGGRVVKNAAGFDLPKLMIGSAGELGVLVEATFKVFPVPERPATVVATHASFAAAHAAFVALGSGATEVEALDLTDDLRVAVRVGGRGSAVRATAERLARALGSATELLEGDDDERYWRDASTFTWAPHSGTIAKAPVRPTALESCERACVAAGVTIARRYSAGGHLAWLVVPAHATADVLRTLRESFPASLIGLTGPSASALQPARWTGAFGCRLRDTFDPHHKFEQQAQRPAG